MQKEWFTSKVERKWLRPSTLMKERECLGPCTPMEEREWLGPSTLKGKCHGVCRVKKSE